MRRVRPLFIEVFQLFLKEADCRLDDVILALLGAFAGYFLFCLLCMYFREAERMGTVKRSRRRNVPIAVRYELEALVILMLLCVMGRGGQLEAARVKEAKALQEQQGGGGGSGGAGCGGGRGTEACGGRSKKAESG